MLIFLLLVTVHAEPFMIYPEKGIGKIECSGECDYMDKVHCTGTANTTYIIWTCENIPAYLAERTTLNISSTMDTININVRDMTLSDYMFVYIYYIIYVVGLAILCILASPDMVYAYMATDDMDYVKLEV